MTGISDILKPKSREDLTKEIKAMSTFEYVDHFENAHIWKMQKKFSVGFKKLLLHFMIQKRKKITRVYNIFILFWFTLIILDLIFKDVAAIEFAESIGTIFFYCLWLPWLLVSFFSTRKFLKWRMNHLDDRVRRAHQAIHDHMIHALEDQEEVQELFMNAMPTMGIPRRYHGPRAQDYLNYNTDPIDDDVEDRGDTET